MEDSEAPPTGDAETILQSGVVVISRAS